METTLRSTVFFSSHISKIQLHGATFFCTLCRWINDLLTSVSLPSLQSTCSWVSWWCTSCCAPSTKWQTCTAWPPSCSCPAVRTTWMKTGSPSWRTTMKVRRPVTWQTKQPAGPWSRDHSPHTTPSTKAELCAGREEKMKLYLWWPLGLETVMKHLGWIWILVFIFSFCLLAFQRSEYDDDDDNNNHDNEESRWVLRFSLCKRTVRQSEWLLHHFLHISKIYSNLMTVTRKGTMFLFSPQHWCNCGVCSLWRLCRYVSSLRTGHEGLRLVIQFLVFSLLYVFLCIFVTVLFVPHVWVANSRLINIGYDCAGTKSWCQTQPVDTLAISTSLCLF